MSSCSVVSCVEEVSGGSEGKVYIQYSYFRGLLCLGVNFWLWKVREAELPQGRNPSRWVYWSGGNVGGGPGKGCMSE